MIPEIRTQIAVCATHWFDINIIYQDFAKKYGITVYQLYILYLLVDEGRPFTQSEIQEAMAMPKTTLNAIVANFQKDGWIELVADADDRRRKIVVLTEKGMAFAGPMLEEMHSIEERAYSRMTREQLRMLSALSTLEAEYLQDAFDEALAGDEA